MPPLGLPQAGATALAEVRGGGGRPAVRRARDGRAPGLRPHGGERRRTWPRSCGASTGSRSRSSSPRRASGCSPRPRWPARLDDRLSLLSGGGRDLPERQRTLRGAIEWSHELLDADQRRLFARLSAFARGGPLDLVEEVARPAGRGDPARCSIRSSSWPSRASCGSSTTSTATPGSRCSRRSTSTPPNAWRRAARRRRSATGTPTRCSRSPRPPRSAPDGAPGSTAWTTSTTTCGRRSSTSSRSATTSGSRTSSTPSGGSGTCAVTCRRAGDGRSGCSRCRASRAASRTPGCVRSRSRAGSATGPATCRRRGSITGRPRTRPDASGTSRRSRTRSTTGSSRARAWARTSTSGA